MFSIKFLLGCALAFALINPRTTNHHHPPPEKLGQVHFSTSCNPTAQSEFDRAVALLHSFQFQDAIHGFNAALSGDPSCGIASWGIALSQWSNPFAPGAKEQSQLQAGLKTIERARNALPKTERERAYVAAVANLYDRFETTSQQTRFNAYRDAMENVAAKYPGDREAQIFYALALAASADPADKTYAARLKAGAIFDRLFALEPNHPGLAHYIIHTYDVPPLASRALDAARRYSEIAPDTPHALHMPSHVFTRTGDWQDSIDSNRAAAAAARRTGQTAEELHASDYLMYAFLQTARDQAARNLLASLPEMHLRFDPNVLVGGAAPPAAGYFALAAIPARYALERRDWRAASGLESDATPFPYINAITSFARGLGAARLGNIAAANVSVKELENFRKQLEAANEAYWADQVEIQRLEVDAWILLAAGEKELALATMKSAALREDGTEKSVITPGPLVPARELLGEMFLQRNDPAAALTEFQTALNTEPNRFRTLYGAATAARLSGKAELSRKYFAGLLAICENADNPPRPEILEAQRAALPD